MEGCVLVIPRESSLLLMILLFYQHVCVCVSSSFYDVWEEALIL